MDDLDFLGRVTSLQQFRDASRPTYDIPFKEIVEGMPFNFYFSSLSIVKSAGNDMEKVLWSDKKSVMHIFKLSISAPICLRFEHVRELQKLGIAQPNLSFHASNYRFRSKNNFLDEFVCTEIPLSRAEMHEGQYVFSLGFYRKNGALSSTICIKSVIDGCVYSLYSEKILDQYYTPRGL